ncbi:hypothetical protein [Phycicoccus sp. Soil803]|uniref:hypothetical protein n=1 Tax=Phycicoccus sp. Soil803 TaxID=1736415 RepID=UPI00070DE8B9|nr:hypothetical protein [Phycicoccus sp. Soil803]KRF25280.1 hypothetical protein ASG95_12870 [Phycicoccus sp. Soil803]
MGFLDRLLGREPLQTQGGYAGPAPSTRPAPSASGPATSGPATSGPASEDDRAIARYRYLLRTAPPEALEQVHAEAFARLTPEQRQQVLAELSSGLPAGESPPTADPQSMARAATRAELRQPGYLEQTFSRGRFGGGMVGGGLGMGGTIMGSMMGTIAGVVIGSAIADSLFDGYDSSPEAAEAGDTSAGSDGTDGSGSDGSGSGSDESGSAESGSDGGDTGGDAADSTGDVGAADAGYDSGGFDSGGFDSGGFGGDFGGGDMGGF